MSTYRLTPSTNATRWGSGSLSAVGTAPASGGQSDGSDSSYLLFAPVPGPFQYTLAAMRVASVAVPSSERVVACRAGGRAWRTTAGTVYANVSAGLPTSGEPRQVGPVGTRTLTGSAVDFASGTGAVLLSQADVDSLRVLVSVVASATGRLARLSESWVELVTASVPRTPTGLAVSSIAVTRPSISWTHTDRTERTTTTKARTGSTATITTSIAHGFVAGQSVGVAVGDAALDGSWVIASVPTSTTFTYTTTTSGTITATAASGTAWTGDDRAQSSARVRVFTAAQYGDAGFDPATSTATWETTVTGGDQSVQVGVDLATATTYRAYVSTSTAAYGTVLAGVVGYVQWTTALATPSAPGTFTAALQSDGSVWVHIVRSGTAPSGSWNPGRECLIERSIDGGATWQRCYSRPGAVDVAFNPGGGVDGQYGVASGFEDCLLRDDEAPRGGVVDYRGRIVWIGPSGVLMSNAATATVAVPGTDAGTRLVTIDQPTATVTVEYVTLDGYSEQTDSQTETYNPPGGGTFVIRRAWAGKQITAQAIVDGVADRAALYAALASGRLLVQSQIVLPSGFASQRYVSVVGTVAEEPITADVWRVTWSMVDIGPVGATVSA